MGAALGPKRGEVMSQINVTPLVDIVLVLLIIFMVTATAIVRASIEAKLPEITTGQQVKTSTLSIELQLGGKLLLNGQEKTEAELKQAIEEARAKDPDVQALVAADERVTHGEFVRLVDRIRAWGVSKFAILGERKR